MKTPTAKRGAVRIVVQPPHGRVLTASAPVSQAEAGQVVRAIRPRFAEYVAQYNTKKYWPDVYRDIRREFRQPQKVGPGTLRKALLWKYGHLGKAAIPPAHEVLISQLQRGWSTAAAALPRVPEEAFVAINRDFGGKTRFITVAFLLHLLHPRRAPIIDQHNFRAVNALLADVRPTWKTRRQPSSYADIALVAAFMAAILGAWSRRSPESVPSARDLDLFLMMYGKAIKERSNSVGSRRRVR